MQRIHTSHWEAARKPGLDTILRCSWAPILTAETIESGWTSAHCRNKCAQTQERLDSDISGYTRQKSLTWKTPGQVLTQIALDAAFPQLLQKQGSTYNAEWHQHMKAQQTNIISDQSCPCDNEIAVIHILALLWHATFCTTLHMSVHVCIILYWTILL